MKIGGFQKQSLIDYPGRISSIIFTIGCNFRCPFCHNPELVIPSRYTKEIFEEEISQYLQNNRKYLEGVVITGGEPTIHKDLLEFIKKIKELGFLVKLDTNGTNPKVLRGLIDKKLVDYIAMDIKTNVVFSKYNKAVGGISKELLKKVKESIFILLNSEIDYEFRTTVVPGIVSKEDVIKISKFVGGVKKYCLQQFKPLNTLNNNFQKLKPFEEDEIKSWLLECKKYCSNIELRNF